MFRSFINVDGVEWQVWDTIPSQSVGATLEGGWLTFLSTAEKRRLAPLPLYWVSATDDQLRELLAKSWVVTERPGERAGTRAPDERIVLEQDDPQGPADGAGTESSP